MPASAAREGPETPMKTLVMVPALGCDQGLYAPLARGLDGIVSLQTIIADGDRMETCVKQVLKAAPEKFVILGTSFGGRVALETALAAPDRVEGLIVIGASAGPSPDPAAGSCAIAAPAFGRIRAGRGRNGRYDRASSRAARAPNASRIYPHGRSPGRRVDGAAIRCARPSRRSCAAARRNRLPGARCCGASRISS